MYKRIEIWQNETDFWSADALQLALVVSKLAEGWVRAYAVNVGNGELETIIDLPRGRFGELVGVFGNEVSRRPFVSGALVGSPDRPMTLMMGTVPDPPPSKPLPPPPPPPAPVDAGEEDQAERAALGAMIWVNRVLAQR